MMNKLSILLCTALFVTPSVAFAKTVRVVYKSDGSVAVIHPVEKSKREGEAEKEWLKRVFEEAMVDDLENMPYQDVDAEQLPKERKYRNAWEGAPGRGVWVNAVKAAQIDLQQQELEQ